MALEIFELLTGFGSAVDGLSAIVSSVLRLFGVAKEKAKDIAARLVIFVFCLILIGAAYAAFKYL